MEGGILKMTKLFRKRERASLRIALSLILCTLSRDYQREIEIHPVYLLFYLFIYLSTSSLP